MRVLVIGGGIGGLATAIGLRQQGHEPIVFEQAPQLRESCDVFRTVRFSQRERNPYA